MKRCSNCGKLKNESEFPKDRTRKDGLHQRCKACKNAYSRRHYKNLLDAQESKTGTKKCSGCGKLKKRKEFSKDKTKKDGLYHLCKICRSAYRRKNKEVKTPIIHEGGTTGEAGNFENKDIGVLSVVYAEVERGVCSACGRSLMGYIPGYLHGKPVCKSCIIINLKSMRRKKHIRK